MWEWLKTLFSFRRLLRERDEAIRQLTQQTAEQDGAITMLLHALVYATTPITTPDEPGRTDPIRIPRKTRFEMQQQYEFEHNMLLRRMADKKKYGML